MNHKSGNFIALVSIFFIFTLYMGTVLRYVSFMPISDDYGAILLFLNQYVSTDDMLEHFKMLFSQHNEHRIVFNRIVEILQYKIMGEVDFKVLILLGNSGWLLLIFFLWKYVQSKRIVTTLAFLPVILIMLTYSHAALMTWAMASLQQYWQLFFSVVTIYYLTHDRLYKTLVFMAISLFTGGGGILLLPMVNFYYLIHKKWRYFLISFCVTFLLIGIYFFLFKYYPHSEKRDFYAIIIENYDRFFSYFLCYLGNVGEIAIVAKSIAMGLLGLFLFKSKKLYQKEPFLFFLILFVCGIAFLTAIVRSHFGEAQALSSRYGIYSVFFLALVYLQYVVIYKNNKFIISLGLVLGLSIFSFYYIYTKSDFLQRKNVSETILDHPVYAYAEHILSDSKRLGIFNPNIIYPSTLLQAHRKKERCLFHVSIGKNLILSDKNSSIIKKIDINISVTTLDFMIDGWVYDSVNEKSASAVMTVLDGRKKLIFLTHKKDNISSMTDYFKTNIDASSLKEGKHTLEIRVLDTKGTGYYTILMATIHKAGIKSLLKLPIKKGGLRGWIDKFDVRNKTITITGWYAFLGKTVDSKIVLLDIDGTKYLTHYGDNSSGVAEVLDNEAYAKAGFKLVLSKASLSKGKHKLHVYILSDDLNTLYEADKIFEFEVK